MLEDDPLWYKDAVIYELHIKAFFDSDDDGIGDFRGLIRKLDYLQDLGVNTLWLLPFYPSPMRDDGYDIADYRNIHPEYGGMADFRQFVREAHRRDLRVITELVINHTSDQHSWFQSARKAPPRSVKRNYYVWSDSDKKFPETRIIFRDSEKSNWSWDEVAHAFYWHRFFHHQPDLNFNNPHVVKAVMRVMRYWFDTGVDGMRLDAVPYLAVREGTNNENLPETHSVLRYMRSELDKHYRNRMFLAEANQWPEDVRDYFSDGDECHMAYHFPLMPRMYMAIAQEDRHPIVEIMRQTPDIPVNCQWAVFLRNHDELTLEMVTDKERDYMYQMYASEPRARLNLGIRRRLAPLMDNNPDKIKLMNSLLLSMPGSPIIYYGDEIGMGDNFYLGDRNGVRTPMQWSPDRNAGFSHADPQRLYFPPIMDPVYGYEAVNVEAQSRAPSSLLNWMRRLLAVRKNHKSFGRGSMTFLKPANRKILAYLREHEDDLTLCVANLARSAQPVELDLALHKGCVPIEMMGRAAFPPIGELPYLLTLPGHGFYWFQIARGDEIPSRKEDHAVSEEPPMLVLFDSWRSLFRDRVVPWRMAMAEKLRAQLEEEVLPRHVAAQRWYSGKGGTLERVVLADYAEWEEESPWLMALFRIETSAEEQPLYFIPLALDWTSTDESRRVPPLVIIANVRQQARVGVLGDAFSDEAFCHAVVQAIGAGKTLDCAHGSIRFSATGGYAALLEQVSGPLPLMAKSAQSSNTAVVLGDRIFLKCYRRLQAGVHPEWEIGRFLTETAKFTHTVPVVGAVEYRPDEGGAMTLALLQGYIENQGDCWSYTLDYLARLLEETAEKAEPPGSPAEVHGAYLVLMRTLGQRTGELHRALSIRTGDDAFDPEPVELGDLADWNAKAVEEAARAMATLERRLDALTESTRVEARSLLARKETIPELISAYAPKQMNAVKIRYHGDYHLGQALLVQNDFVLIDFEGEPTRPLAQRRRKHSPLRDVASMLRSLNYAAHSAFDEFTLERPESASLEPLLSTWEKEAGRAFIDAYQESVRGAGFFEDTNQLQGLLALFTLEKAFYELRYELDNRPDWVHIPLRGILEILQPNQ